MITDVRLDVMRSTAAQARQFAVTSQDPPYAPLDFIPLSLRTHFDEDFPALFAEIERLRLRIEELEAK